MPKKDKPSENDYLEEFDSSVNSQPNITELELEKNKTHALQKKIDILEHTIKTKGIRPTELEKKVATLEAEVKSYIRDFSHIASVIRSLYKERRVPQNTEEFNYLVKTLKSKINLISTDNKKLKALIEKKDEEISLLRDSMKRGSEPPKPQASEEKIQAGSNEIEELENRKDFQLIETKIKRFEEYREEYSNIIITLETLNNNINTLAQGIYESQVKLETLYYELESKKGVLNASEKIIPKIFIEGIKFFSQEVVKESLHFIVELKNHLLNIEKTNPKRVKSTDNKELSKKEEELSEFKRKLEKAKKHSLKLEGMVKRALSRLKKSRQYIFKMATPKTSEDNKKVVEELNNMVAYLLKERKLPFLDDEVERVISKYRDENIKLRRFIQENKLVPELVTTLKHKIKILEKHKTGESADDEINYEEKYNEIKIQLLETNEKLQKANIKLAIYGEEQE